LISLSTEYNIHCSANLILFSGSVPNVKNLIRHLNILNILQLLLVIRDIYFYLLIDKLVVCAVQVVYVTKRLITEEKDLH